MPSVAMSTSSRPTTQAPSPDKEKDPEAIDSDLDDDEEDDEDDDGVGPGDGTQDIVFCTYDKVSRLQNLHRLEPHHFIGC
jgi:transcription initiation factor TFIIA large subunit